MDQAIDYPQGRGDPASQAGLSSLRDEAAGASSPKASIPVADKYRWRGEGPEPPSWRHEDGTKVYRSYEDYCDD